MADDLIHVTMTREAAQKFQRTLLRAQSALLRARWATPSHVEDDAADWLRWGAARTNLALDGVPVEGPARADRLVPLTLNEYLILCGLVQARDDVNAAGVMAPMDEWETLREKFPLADFLRAVADEEIEYVEDFGM